MLHMSCEEHCLRSNVKIDEELLNARGDLHTGVHQAFIVVLPSFLNSTSLVVRVGALQYPRLATNSETY